METKKIKLLRGVVVNGEAHEKGATVDTDPSDARYLVAVGSAELVEGRKEKAAEK